MPAPAARRKPATYDDLVRVPDHLVAEIVGGELFATPRPAARHARAASVLGMDLGGPFDRGRGGPGGWWILDEPELHLHDGVVVPDLAAWRRERLPAIPDTAALILAPDWICEVVSPSTEALDRGRKLTVYAREGVAHAWLVNPANGMLEVFALDAGRWVLLATHVGAATVRVEPFAAIELDLSDLWSSSS
jgi:Uma2 family endonuclease